MSSVRLREFYPTILAAFADKREGICTPEAQTILAAVPTPTAAALYTRRHLQALLKQADARAASDRNPPDAPFSSSTRPGDAVVDGALHPGTDRVPGLPPGVDAGQDLAVMRGGRGGGHIRDHVGAVRGTGLGQMT